MVQIRKAIQGVWLVGGKGGGGGGEGGGGGGEGGGGGGRMELWMMMMRW